MATFPALFSALVDDAAVFPPGNLPLPTAVKAHRRHRAAWYADLVGPLLWPSARLDDADDVLDSDGGPIGIAIVVSTGAGGVIEATDVVARHDRLVLRGVEIALRGEPLADNARRTVAALDSALGGPDDDEPAFVEVPREPGWEGALDVIAESGYRAKLRTGGADAAAHPSPDELAAFVLACLDRGLQFKLTAGLHRAVRHTNDDGNVEHGFLNVLAATGAALDGADPGSVAQVLSRTDRAAVAELVASLPADRAASVRRWFTSMGSCSIDEPVTDLVELGLLAAPGEVA